MIRLPPGENTDDMSTKKASNRVPAHTAVPVHGLEHSRHHARRHGRRRRRANLVKNTLVAVVAFGVVGGAGYFAWTEFGRDTGPETPSTGGRLTPTEAIEVLEEQPRWNGPGNPTFGVGDEP